jgi:hypothetical protein
MGDTTAAGLVLEGKPPPVPLADERVVRVRLRSFGAAILAPGAVAVGCLAVPGWISRGHGHASGIRAAARDGLARKVH